MTTTERLLCNPCHLEHGRLHVCELAGVPAHRRGWRGQTLLYGRPRPGGLGVMLPLVPFREPDPGTNRPGYRGPRNIYAVPADLGPSCQVWVLDHYEAGPDTLRVCRVVKVGHLGDEHGLGVELEVVAAVDVPSAGR